MLLLSRLLLVGLVLLCVLIVKNVIRLCVNIEFVMEMLI